MSRHGNRTRRQQNDEDDTPSQVVYLTNGPECGKTDADICSRLFDFALQFVPDTSDTITYADLLLQEDQEKNPQEYDDNAIREAQNAAALNRPKKQIKQPAAEAQQYTGRGATSAQKAPKQLGPVQHRKNQSQPKAGNKAGADGDAARKATKSKSQKTLNPVVRGKRYQRIADYIQQFQLSHQDYVNGLANGGVGGNAPNDADLDVLPATERTQRAMSYNQTYTDQISNARRQGTGNTIAAPHPQSAAAYGLNISTESDDKHQAHAGDEYELVNQLDISTERPRQITPPKRQKFTLWDEKKNPYASAWPGKGGKGLNQRRVSGGVAPNNAGGKKVQAKGGNDPAAAAAAAAAPGTSNSNNKNWIIRTVRSKTDALQHGHAHPNGGVGGNNQNPNFIVNGIDDPMSPPRVVLPYGQFYEEQPDFRDQQQYYSQPREVITPPQEDVQTLIDAMREAENDKRTRKLNLQPLLETLYVNYQPSAIPDATATAAGDSQNQVVEDISVPLQPKANIVYAEQMPIFSLNVLDTIERVNYINRIVL